MIPECDGRSDGQTESIVAKTALCIASYADALSKIGYPIAIRPQWPATGHKPSRHIRISSIKLVSAYIFQIRCTTTPTFEKN